MDHSYLSECELIRKSTPGIASEFGYHVRKARDAVHRTTKKEKGSFMEDHEIHEYALIGMAAMRHGYQRAITALQEKVTDLDATMARLQPASNSAIEVQKRRGRPPKALVAAAAGTSVKS